MKSIIIFAAVVLGTMGVAVAAPDCSNFGGSNLVGCGASDFYVDPTQDQDMTDHSGYNGSEGPAEEPSEGPDQPAI